MPICVKRTEQYRCYLLICWILGHDGQTGNEKRDVLAWSVDVPLRQVKGNFKKSSSRDCKRFFDYKRRRRNLKTSVAKTERKKNYSSTADKRKPLRTLIGVLNGCCILRNGLQENDIFRSCGEKEEPESVNLLRCKCPVLARTTSC